MDVKFTTIAVADLLAMPARDAGRVVKALDKLSAAANTGRIAEEGKNAGVDITAIVGGANAFRVRVGDWRALLSIVGDQVTVGRVLNRRDAYG